MSASLPNLAATVLAARRSLDLSPSDAARACGVEEDVLRRAEQGEPVDARVADALTRGLRIVLPPNAPSTVAPEDDFHARELAHMVDLASRDEGALLVPDVAALVAAVGVTADDLAEARSLESAPFRAGLPSIVATVVLALDLAVAAGCVLAGHGDWSSIPFIAVGIVGALAVVVDALARNFRRNARDRSDVVARIASLNTRRHALRRVGYVVTPRSLVVLNVERGGTTRREVLASSMTNLSVDVEGPDHVTIRMRTLTGPVDIAWVRRSDALDTALVAWRLHATAPVRDAPR